MTPQIKEIVRDWCMKNAQYSPSNTKIEDLLKDLRFDYMVDLLQHNSWRCRYYEKCHCGLDEVNEHLGFDKVPYEYCTE